MNLLIFKIEMHTCNIEYIYIGLSLNVVRSNSDIWEPYDFGGDFFAFV